jgi:endonuclease/exonuclease/phosphatase (EEP) superfamily protein YafD
MNTNLLDNINKIINHKENINTIIGEINKKIIKPQPSKLEFRKYDRNNPQTDISNNAFYNENGIYFLTNGANKNISGAGGGTTHAINSISPLFFDHNKFQLIFDSSTIYYNLNLTIQNIIRSPDQMTRTSLQRTNGYYAGSVFYIENRVSKNRQLIGGVYHINGINWNNIGGIDHYLSVLLIFSYFDAIINDFINEAKKDPNKLYILDLAQIPGGLYDGGEETLIGMIQAVNENQNEIAKNNVKIILDMPEDFYLQYKSQKPISVLSMVQLPQIQLQQYPKSAPFPSMVPQKIQLPQYSKPVPVQKQIKEYSSLLEFVADPNPHALSKEEADRIQPDYENKLMNCTLNRDGMFGSFWFRKEDVAKANNITLDQLHNTLKQIPDKGANWNHQSLDDPDENKNKRGLIRFANSNQYLLYFDYDPLWRYLHTYLGTILQDCFEQQQMPTAVPSIVQLPQISAIIPSKIQPIQPPPPVSPTKRAYLFKSTTNFYIIANITKKDIIDRLDERRRKLLLGFIPIDHGVLHITLLQFEINQKNPKANFFKNNNELRQKITVFYNNTFRKDNVVLKYTSGAYDLLGQTENKFLTKIYEPDQPLVITDFRKQFYKYLGSQLGRYTINEKVIDGKKYHVFNFGGQDLFGVPDYYFGTGVWKPHISIVNVGNIREKNPQLYEKYDKAYSKQEKIEVLLEPIRAVRFGPIGDISMRDDLKSLTISLENKLSADKFKEQHEMNLTLSGGASSIKVLTYNVRWEAMTGESSKLPQCENNVCAENIKNFIIEQLQQSPYDFIALQESSNHEIIINAINEQYPDTYTYEHYKSGKEDMVTIWNKHKFHLDDDKILTWFGDSRGRPIQVLFFKQKICFINLHAGHWNNRHKPDDRINTLNQSIKANKAIKDKLETYKIIMAGDFNDTLAHNSLIFLGRQFYDKTPEKSFTCGDPRLTGVGHTRAFDHILYTGDDNGLRKILHPGTNASDHLPVVANLKGGSYEKLNIAYDFDGVFHKSVGEPDSVGQRHALSLDVNTYVPFMKIIEQIKQQQREGHKIFIITAHCESFLVKKYLQKFKLQNIKIFVTCNGDKSKILKKYHIHHFYDDSILRINEILKQKANLPDLKELFMVIPEEDRWIKVYPSK